MFLRAILAERAGPISERWSARGSDASLKVPCLKKRLSWFESNLEFFVWKCKKQLRVWGDSTLTCPSE